MEKKLGEVVIRRQFAVWPVLIGASVVVVVALVLLAIFALLIKTPSHTDLTVVNNTASALTGAGFTDHDNERCISVGDVPAGELRKTSADFDAPDSTGSAIPIGFSFDQNGRTFRIPMSGQNIANGTTYKITVTPGQVAVVYDIAHGPITSYVQAAVPSK